MLVLKCKKLDSLIVNVYRPLGTLDVDFHDAMNVFEEAIDTDQAHGEYGTILGTGDWNFRTLKWENYKIKLDLALTGQQIRFAKFLDTYFLSNYVVKPTRESSLLDLVLCNDSNMVTGVKHIINNRFSDNQLLVSSLGGVGVDQSNSEEVRDKLEYLTKIPNYKTDSSDEDLWKKYNEDLNKKVWLDVAKGLSIVDKLNLLYNSIGEVVGETFEEKTDKKKK